jgi:PAS domain S-box-containing protein
MSEQEMDSLPHNLEKAQKRIRELEDWARQIEKEQGELSKSESEHRTAFENSGTGMVVIREDFMVIMANRRIQDIIGFPSDEVRYKRKWTDFVLPEDIPMCAAYHVARRQSPESAPSEYEFRVVDKDRAVRWVLANVAMIPGTKHSLVSMIDISSRKVTERALQESEKRFRTIFQQSPIGIALMSHDGKLLDMNQSFKTTFNPPEGGSGFDLFSLMALTPEEKENVCLGSGLQRETLFSGEATAGASGMDEKRWFDWHITPLGNGEGSPAVCLVLVEDITRARQEQEEKLARQREATQKAEALVAGLRYELLEKARFHSMVSRSPEMRKIFDVLPEIAGAEAPVLISGESGTGKELIAQSLHDLSVRKGKPFVAINCAALPDNLLESELFGYRAGAFTDAKKDKPGKFALAEGGTIFFDEIGDISAAMQVKLLRVLQERKYEPLGATNTVKTDVHVLAATNRDLDDMVKKGAFREDLYYRINVVAVRLPPLRDRRCDIPLLCDHFIERFNARFSKAIKGISQDAMEAILVHDFPGNIRELENLIEHAFVFCKSAMVEVQHLPAPMRKTGNASDTDVLARIDSFDELEKMYINAVLKEVGGNKERAAHRLRVHKATLFRKLKKLGIQ